MNLVLEIVNDKGLHARASAKFVETVERFDACAHVSRDGLEVAGDSIMGLMMLGAAMGDTITLHCDGDGCDEALDQLSALVTERFGED